jgi:hypothetical protein
MAAAKSVFFCTDRPEISQRFRDYALPCKESPGNCSLIVFGKAILLVPLAQHTSPPWDTELVAFSSDGPKLTPSGLKTSIQNSKGASVSLL